MVVDQRRQGLSICINMIIFKAKKIPCSKFRKFYHYGFMKCKALLWELKMVKSGEYRWEIHGEKKKWSSYLRSVVSVT